MDRHWDVCPFYHTPYLERQLDQEHFEREISSCAHDAGRACILDTLYNGRFDDKRHYPFPPCAVFSAHKRRALLCKESAYGFRLLGGVLMSVHLGFHWSMITGMAKRLFPKPSVVRKWAGRVLALVISGYGVYAFIKRDIGDYMLLRSHFVFFDYDEPLVFFYLDYIAVMGLFLLIGNYACAGLRMIGRGQRERKH